MNHIFSKPTRCAFAAFPLFTSLLSDVSALDIEFLIFDNETHDLRNSGHLEEGSVFLRELYEAGLYLGKRIDSDETLKIGIHVEYGFGGTAKAAPRPGSDILMQYNGEQALVRQPAPLEHVLSPGFEAAACTAHMDIWYDTDLLFEGDQHQSFFPPGTMRGTTFHEMAHGLGVTSVRVNGEDFLASSPDGIVRQPGEALSLNAFDLLIDRIDGEHHEFAVGGETVEAVYGRQVRLREAFYDGNFSHIGQSSPHTIRADGVFQENTQSSPLGEFGNVDVNTSVTSAGMSYSYPTLLTPIDVAIFKDLGYPVAPLNAAMYFNTNAREGEFSYAFTKTITVPFLKVEGGSDELLSVHLMLEGENRFNLLGLANTDEDGFIHMEEAAGQALNSPVATFDGQTLHVPNIELYSDGQVVHYAAVFQLVSAELPHKFELVSAVPVASNTLGPVVDIVHCP